jgi:chromosome segregation ATPase
MITKGATRQVTDDDLAHVDNAIANHQVFLRDLFTLRKLLAEIGSVDKAIANNRAGLQVITQERDLIGAQLEQAKSDLVTVQAREVEQRKQVAALDREIAEKQGVLDNFSREIDRIVGTAA